MLPDHTLIPACDRPRASGRSAQRSPILLLDHVDGTAARRPVADLIARRSVHAIALPGRPAALARPHQRNDDTALLAWRRLQVQFHAVCVGLIAAPGQGLADAARILAACWHDGTAPGAVALLGFSPDFVATCLSLPIRAGSLAKSCRKAGDGAAGSPPALSEWPPMVIILPADDPAIGECAVACRQMQAAGIPIRLEIMRGTATDAAVEAAVADLVVELDRFFAAHLTPSFPKLL